MNKLNTTNIDLEYDIAYKQLEIIKDKMVKLLTFIDDEYRFIIEKDTNLAAKLNNFYTFCDTTSDTLKYMKIARVDMEVSKYERFNN